MKDPQRAGKVYARVDIEAWNRLHALLQWLGRSLLGCKRLQCYQLLGRKAALALIRAAQQLHGIEVARVHIRYQLVFDAVEFVAALQHRPGQQFSGTAG